MQNILLAKAKIDSMDIIPDEDVDQALDQQVESIMAQLGSEGRFEEVMGQSIRDFREEHWYDIRKQIIAERYQFEKITSVKTSRDEVQEFYYTYKDSLPPVDTKYELSQIILPILSGEEAKEQAYKTILNLKDSLNHGASFSDLARRFSDDEVSKNQGGNLGLVRRGELVPRFEEAAFSLEEGQISDIVETVFGYHIIQLLEKQGERINVSHLLVKVEPTSADRDKALERIRNYYYLLADQPTLFDSLVKEISNNDNPHSDLGYIGWLEYSKLPNESYKNAIYGTVAGDITPPFQTKDGFHILNVINVKEGGIPTLEEYYPQIEAFALRDKQIRYINTWLDRIRKDIFIRKID
ncbi:MAG: peptidylprolyl isomerase [Candidatus Neomarinimicrobiota bacterium]